MYGGKNEHQATSSRLLVSGFSAIACLKACSGDFSRAALSPRNFLRLTDRLDRLRRAGWPEQDRHQLHLDPGLRLPRHVPAGCPAHHRAHASRPPRGDLLDFIAHEPNFGDDNPPEIPSPQGREHALSVAEAARLTNSR